MPGANTREAATAAYEAFLYALYPPAASGLVPELSRRELVRLWLDARLGHGGETLHHGPIRVLDFGLPATQEAAPAILRAEIECDGLRRRGDIALHTHAESWESEGCGEAAEYADVILHVVLQAPSPHWFTRAPMHRDIPVLVVPPQRLRRIFGCAALHPGHTPGTQELRGLPIRQIENLLTSAAAYRAELKRAHFEQKTAVVGHAQAAYEAWAEVLGYAANKEPLAELARRAPLATLRPGQEEAVLLGVAGFLQAVLPPQTSGEARSYHRRVWNAWWQQRERFELCGQAPLRWVLSPVRPMNHPFRRVAALALSAACWDELLPLCNAAGAARLADKLNSLSHPFWDNHCTLTSAPLRTRCALVGRSRIEDFLVNVIYPCDTSAAAWAAYGNLRAQTPPRQLCSTAAQLFGERAEIAPLLRRPLAQQGLRQLAADWGSNGTQPLPQAALAGLARLSS